MMQVGWGPYFALGLGPLYELGLGPLYFMGGARYGGWARIVMNIRVGLVLYDICIWIEE